MGKRFTPTHVADMRAINLYHQLREIEQMPLIEVSFPEDRKTIYISERANHLMYMRLSVDAVLLLDVQKAKTQGGTYRALIQSRKRPLPRVSDSEVSEGINDFFSDDGK